MYTTLSSLFFPDHSCEQVVTHLSTCLAQQTVGPRKVWPMSALSATVFSLSRPSVTIFKTKERMNVEPQVLV